ncbi:MAG: hypothetical protein M3N06_07625 [Pseudomonadota bacterium]|nr:hypothetical protein [Pseudomonadota bacterium]
MVEDSKSVEFKRAIAEADRLRAKLKIARDGHTRDGEKLARLERTIAVLDREIAETARVIGYDLGKRG